MISEYSEKTINLDPRTEILLLIIANIVAFMQRSLYIEVAFIILLTVLLLCCDCKKAAIKWSLVFCSLLVLQYYVFPIAPKVLSNTFSFLSLYFRKFFPCLMVGTLIVKKTSVRHFTFALQKWKFPQQLIIPLSITIRYFPAMKEEVSHIRDAIKLRRIKGFAKVEYYMVPLMISASKTAEELSAAAVTRGIENPVKKTSIIDLHFHIRDYLCLAIGIAFIVVAGVMR